MPANRGGRAMFFAALLAVLTACRPAAGPGQAAGEPPAPGTAALSTNDADGLGREFQEELLKEKLRDRVFKPYRSSEDSLGGMLPSSPVMSQRALSPAEARRLKERLSQNRNWDFDDQGAPDKNATLDNDANQTLTENASLERDTLTLLKRYHDQAEASRLSPTNASGRNRNLATGGRADDYQDRTKDSTYRRPTDKPGGDEPLKELFDPKSFGKLKVPEAVSLFTPVFAPSTSIPLERAGAGELRRKEFRELLESGPPGAERSSSPFNSPALTAPGLAGPDNTISVGSSLPTMSTIPGYKPDFGTASSLSPALSGAATPSQLPQPETPRMSEFNRPTGPPRRQF